MDIEIVDSLIIYEKKYQSINSDCPICHNNINEHSLTNTNKSEKINIIKSKCGHCYHKECISSWIKYQSTCPLCISKFVEESNINI